MGAVSTIVSDVFDLGGDIVEGAVDTVSDAVGGIDEFVQENIPGGWILPVVVAAPLLAPELFAAEALGGEALAGALGDEALAEVLGEEALAEALGDEALAEVLGEEALPELLDATEFLDLPVDVPVEPPPTIDETLNPIENLPSGAPGGAPAESIPVDEPVFRDPAFDEPPEVYDTDLKEPGLLDAITPQDALNAARVAKQAAGLLGIGATVPALLGGGEPSTSTIPAGWIPPAYTPYEYTAPVPIDFGSPELLLGTQWEKYLSPATPTPPQNGPGGISYSELMRVLGGGGIASIDDIISGIQNQYGQTDQGAVGQ